MTREERDHLRQRIDAARREEILHEAARLQGRGCKGCGGDLDGRTTGCKTCWDRSRRQKRREDPVLREHDRRIWRESSRRLRAQKKAA